MTWNEIRTYINNWITQNTSKSNRGDKLNNSLTYICNETEAHTLDTNIHITTTERTNWNTAYGWGNHAGLYSLLAHTHAGVYEPVLGNPGVDGYVLASTIAGARSWVSNSPMVYPSAGIALSTGSAWGASITDNSSNWNTAYGWGDHAGLYRPVAWVPAWGDVTDKPTTFTPSTHGNGSHSTDLVGEPGVIDAKDAKTTPVDADVMILEDSEDLAVGLKKPKKITWANIKATLKIYFDTLYETAGALAGHLLAYAHGDIAHTNRIDLDLVSGTNTGDQDLSGLALKTGNLLITYTENDLGNSGAAKTVPFDTHNYTKITLTADCTLTLTAPESGLGRFQIRVYQDGTGGWDLIFPTGVNGVVFSQGAFDFTAGTAGQYCIVTIDWNGTFYTANATDWADVPS